MGRWAPHPITLRQLQYVLAVAEHQSFRRAAEACHVAQPSLSSQIALLESTLGIKVFERLTRGVLVTEAGELVLERARRIVIEADDLVIAASHEKDPFAGTLRVGVIPTVAPYLLPEIARAVKKTYPRLAFVWVEEKTRGVVARISSGELDAGILAVESDLGELDHAVLGRDPFMLAVPPNHPCAKRDRLARPADLDGETVLLLDDGHCFRDQALSVCRRAGADEASVRATSLSTLAQMVAGGTGVTLLPAIAVAAENRARGLAIKSFGPRGPSRTLTLAWRKSNPSATALRAIAATLSDVVGRATANAEP